MKVQNVYVKNKYDKINKFFLELIVEKLVFFTNTCMNLKIINIL
jgi:hypothetical protein